MSAKKVGCRKRKEGEEATTPDRSFPDERRGEFEKEKREKKGAHHTGEGSPVPSVPTATPGGGGAGHIHEVLVDLLGLWGANERVCKSTMGAVSRQLGGPNRPQLNEGGASRRC